MWSNVLYQSLPHCLEKAVNERGSLRLRGWLPVSSQDPSVSPHNGEVTDMCSRLSFCWHLRTQAFMLADQVFLPTEPSSYFLNIFTDSKCLRRREGEREKGKEADLCKESYFFKGSFKFKEFESRSRMNLALIKSVFYKPYKARRL